MKCQLLAASAFTCLATASSVGRIEIEGNALASWKRATAQGPDGYAPAPVDCPSTRPSIRNASDLSDAEKSWLQKRRPNTIDPMRELLTRLNITGFDAGQYIDNNRNDVTKLPNIGLAFSGGGYRAMLNGAGALAAFDTRTSGSTGANQLGGLLQSSTYIAGLSGGGWLVGTVYTNNFTSIQNIISQNEDGDVWQLGNSILQGPKQGGIQILNTADYFKNLVDTVKAKEDANFDVSLTDYWSRGLAFQFVNASDGGPAFTFSSIQDDVDFKDGNTPFPLIVALERAPGEVVLSLNATNIEFNPFEMGSYDPTLRGFAPLKFLGSNFSNGQLPDDQKCIAGFDNAGFVMGTSSSLFNQILLNIPSGSGIPGILTSAISAVLGAISEDNNDIADYTPNPFKGFNSATNPSANLDRLTLVDGGEDLQNIPLIPLIQPQRAVDVIFAIDSSADTVPPTTSAQNWPNGTSLVATFERATKNKTMQNGTPFPFIPDQNTFVNFGFNNRPTFFGCDANNLTADGISPLIVYVPNSPYVFNSNTSTFEKLAYTNEERNAMILNGYNIATMANGTRAGFEDWPTCAGCAIISRSLARNEEDVPEVCQQCFTKYCWNGTLASNTPAPYFPSLVLQAVDVKSGESSIIPNIIRAAGAAALSGYLMS